MLFSAKFFIESSRFGANGNNVIMIIRTNRFADVK